MEKGRGPAGPHRRRRRRHHDAHSPRTGRFKRATLVLAAAGIGSLIFPAPVAQANPDCLPPPSGMIAWWRGDGDATDSVAGRDATANGGATFTTGNGGKVGEAFSLDGTSGYFEIPHDSVFNLSSAITIEAWVLAPDFADDPDQFSPILAKGDSAWRMQRHASSDFAAFGTSGLSNVDQVGNDVIDGGVWHHVAATFDDAVGDKILYVDGAVDALDLTTTGSISTNSQPLRIGNNSEVTTRFWGGLIDEVTLYNRALSAAEIAAIDAADIDGKCKTSTTLTVTRPDDPPPDSCLPADCSLREAVVAANGVPGSDTINVPDDDYELTRAGADEDEASTGDLDITEDVTIAGEGAAGTIIESNDLDRVFHVLSGTTVDISGVTIRNGTGNATTSADPTNGWGGGIYNAGSLTLTDTIVTQNVADNDDPDTFQGRGGGIYNNAGTLVLDGSSVTDNTAPTSTGLSGGIFSVVGGLTLTDSEVSGNTAGAQAAGIEADGSTVSITGSTISDNRVIDSGSALAAGLSAEGGALSLINSTVSGNFVSSGSAFAGGIFYRDMAPTITNTTIANNSGITGAIHRGSGPDVAATNVIVSGNSGPECNMTITSTAGNNLESGTSCFQAGDLQSTDPLLGALSYNGGPTKTQALGTGSPAIDAGTNTGCPTHDQRGVGRSVAAGGDAMCDIGAFEVAPYTFTPTRTDDPPPDGCVPSDCSLREAVIAANDVNGEDTIELPDSYDLAIPGTGEDDAATGDLDILDSVNIQGGGASSTFIDAHSIDRVFHVLGGTVDIADLTIYRGGDSVDVCHGAGLYNVGQTVSITDSAIENNTGGAGAGLNNSGTMTITGSTISGNTAYKRGGGIENAGTLTITNSTISGNTGGIATSSSDPPCVGTGIFGAGGIFNEVGSTTTLDFTTISGNSPGNGSGAGIYNIAGGTVEVASTIVNNTCNGTVTSNGHNIQSDPSCGFSDNAANPDPDGDWETDPLLGALAYNGGETRTHELTAPSPAIDASTNTCSPAFDQRGATRPADGPDGDSTATCDIGSYEYAGGVTLTVNVTDDTTDGSCNSTHCSLREAILAANAFAGSDTIEFDIPAAGVQTIQPTSELPSISDSVTIDGYTQTGAAQATSIGAATILIEIDGSLAGVGGDGLAITTADSIIRGLSITSFDFNGIQIPNSNATGNVIEGNYIGVAPDGLTAAGNGNDGVFLEGAAQDNLIGGTTPEARNIIGANAAAGIEIKGLFTQSNDIFGNYIGTSAAGDAAVPNLTGISITSPNNSIGNGLSGGGNLISGNVQDGVYINDADAAGGTFVADQNEVQGNLIGTDAAGTSALANGGNGIRLNGAQFNVVGGDSATEQNVISGNSLDGLLLSTIAQSNVVLGNRIGVDMTGADLPNGESGVEITGDSAFNTIGDIDAGEGNVIAASPGSFDGVEISDNSSNANSVRGNSITGNGGLGIDLAPNGVTANDTDDADIGVANEGQNFPVITGVSTTASTTVDGTLNSTPGGTFDIDFYSNDACDSSTHGEGQTYLGSTQVADGNSDGDVTFQAILTPTIDDGDFVTATATDFNTGDTSEFSACFPNPPLVVNSTDDDVDASTSNPACDTGSTVGSLPECTLRAAIEQANAATGPDDIEFDIPDADTGCAGTAAEKVCTIKPASGLPTISDPVSIDGYSQTGADTATASVPADLKVEIDGTNAGNPASALVFNAGSSTIKGLVINRFLGHAIDLSSGNDNVVQGSYIGTSVDGLTSLGNAGIGIRVRDLSTDNTIGGTTPAERNVISGNGTQGIDVGSEPNAITGNYIGVNALGHQTPNDVGNNQGVRLIRPSSIGGTAPGAGNVISGNTSAGIDIQHLAAGAVVEGNLIGTDATGEVDIGNGFGVAIFGTSGNTTSIGGTTAAARNVISGNDAEGIRLTSSASAVVVSGNYIGTDDDGTTDLGNGTEGILLFGGSGNTIGGAGAGAGNVISGNDGAGVKLANSNSSTTLHGNGIGVGSSGGALGNTDNGVLIDNSGDSSIGGTGAGEANTIANNGMDGVLITGSGDGNTVTGNSILANGQLGIDLGADEVTANDAMDVDAGGPNEFQNFPIVTAPPHGSTTVQGTLNSTTSSTFDIHVYSSTACDGSGNGEGRTYLGTGQVTTDVSGNGPFTVTVSPALTGGQVVTATATDSTGNTSEFSACATVQSPPGPGGGDPPTDTDDDGIPDSTDQCDNAAEDVDGFEDADGCPDPDNDEDNIPDANDACPNEAEDLDGFEDSDGCPEPGSLPPAPTLPECQTDPAAHCGTDGDDNITITGDGQTWYLGAGDDTIVVTGCNNVIYLQDGNDHITLPADCPNTVFMGDGDDVGEVAAPSPARSTAGDAAVAGVTIGGETGNDVIRGGTHDDTLRGGQGQDLVTGKAGNDSLKGGGGPDKLRGGKGNDTLKGGSATDSCKGGPGPDTLKSCE